MDFDTLDQSQYDLALRFEIDRSEFVGNGTCKFLQPVDDQKQFTLSHPVLPGFLDLLIDLL